MKTKSTIRWVIVGNCGLYTGQYLTRRDAINDHCRAKYIIGSPFYPTVDVAWQTCKDNGDRAIKATISWETPS